MSKSKPQTTTAATDTSQHIPDWLSNAGEEAVNRGVALSNRPYTPYTGELVAPQSNDTLKAYQRVSDIQGYGQPAFDASLGAYNNLVGQAKPITAGGVNDNTNALFGNFQQGVYNPAAANLAGAQAQSQGLLGSYLGQGPATADQVASNAQTLMSPYIQNVINPTIQAGQQQLALAKQGIAAQANNVGAFGGSRMGVQEGVADAQVTQNTQNQIAQMMNQGWGQALNPATQVALQGGQQAYGAAGSLAQQGFSGANNLNSLLGQGYGNAATGGQGLSNTNLQAGLTAAGQLPNVATADQAYGIKDAAALQASGNAQSGYQQQLDNAKYGQYYDQQNYPIQNLDLLLGAVGGVPYSTQGTGYNQQTQTLNKNVAGSVLGGAASGAQIGAVAGPYGMAAGAAIGGLLGGLS